MGARLFVRWAARDLRARWTVVLATALVLAIGAGLFATLGAMKQWRIDSADASFAALQAHDLRAELPSGSYARAGELSDAAQDVRAVRVAEERLVLPAQLTVPRHGGPLRVAGRVVGGAAADVDRLAVRRGRVPSREEAGRAVAVLEAGFGEKQGLPATGTLRVGSRAVRWTGHARAPEYFVVSRDGAVWGAEASFGVLFTSLATAQSLARRPDTVNEVVVRLAAGADPRAAQRALERAFARRHGMDVTVTRLDQEDAHRFLYRDAENDQRVMLVFAVLILLGAGLGAFNLIGRVVEAQRREIGIGMALGVAPLRLALRPMLLGAEVGLLGAGLGVGVALGTAELFRPLLADMLPLPVIRADFQAGYFALGAALAVVVPLAAAALPVWRGVRMTPIEAIRVGFRAAKGAGLAGALRRVPLPGRSLGQMPLRNVLRAPRRTGMTVVGLAAVIAVVVATGGMIDSFDATTARARAEVERGAPDRVVVTLDGFRPLASPVVRAIADAAPVGLAEAAIAVPARVGAGGRAVDVALQVLPAHARAWRPTVVEGRGPAASLGLLLSRRAADELGVEVGDPLPVRHPVREGSGALGSATTLARVSGIHGSPFRQVAIGGPAWARALRLEGRANTVSVVPAPGSTADGVQAALAGLPGVGSIEPASAATRTLQDAMGQFGAVLRIAWVFGLALALLMAFNATTINADERRREHATMLAFGLTGRRVLGVLMRENTVVGILGTGLGLLVGLALLHWITGHLVTETFPDLAVAPVVGAATAAAAACAGVLAAAVAPVAVARGIRSMDVPSALRVME
jgi:putative ABC transport system permease protein